MGIPDPNEDPQFYDGVVMRRFMAFLIDTVVIVGLWLVGVVFTFGIGLFFIFPFFIFIAFIYRWLMLAKGSATLGMKLTGIEVRSPTGNYLSNSEAALHTAAFTVTLLFPPLAIIGWFLMASSPERRAMHDLPFGTVVINRPT